MFSDSAHHLDCQNLYAIATLLRRCDADPFAVSLDIGWMPLIQIPTRFVVISCVWSADDVLLPHLLRHTPRIPGCEAEHVA